MIIGEAFTKLIHQDLGGNFSFFMNTLKNFEKTDLIQNKVMRPFSTFQC